ncbi:MAG TPA: cysteine methyltransferase [Solibacterales bacterium]|nr:cysteine methyltransferase [Bryobacterales bacterium]
MFRDILQVVSSIPRGKVATYGAIAAAAGHPGCARQVVWALRSSSTVPWHRVVGAGGVVRLSGEPGLEQRLRLAAEGVDFKGRRIDLARHGHHFPASD